MQGKFVTQAEFESFKKNELSAALSFLSINLKNPNVENQAAARALGYSSYEALQPLFAREAAIRSSFYIEKASEQGNRLTIKSGNIVAVFDFNELAVYAKSLVNGEEFLYLTESNSTAKVDLSIFSKTDRYLLESLLDFKPEVVDGGSKYSFGSTSGLQIVREKDGLSIGLLGKDKGTPQETLRLKFDDCGGDSSEVDLITPKELQIKPCETFYKFVTPQKDTDSGEVRYYNLDSSQFEVNLSSLMFESPEKAFEAIESGDYGWSAEDLVGASLVKVEYKLEHNLTNLSEDAYDDDGEEGCEIDLIAPKSPRVGITMEYVDSRKEDFLRAYNKAAVCFGHSDETIERWMANMEKRLQSADYKLYSNSPIGHLHAAKRIVRNAIRVAIETAPARKEQINKWRTEYSEYCAKEQQRFPSMTFFSFEHAYSKKLKISFKKYKEFFKI